MVRQLLEETIEKFNERARTDAKLQEATADKVRTVLIELEGGTAFHFTMDRGHIPELLDGPLEGADIRVMTDEATLTGVLKGEISGLKAYATKRLKLKASLQDLLTIRSVFMG